MIDQEIDDILAKANQKLDELRGVMGELQAVLQQGGKRP